jgi:hypothetical protein
MSAPIGSVVKGVSLPENYIKLLQFKRLSLTQVIEYAWPQWRRLQRNDWPPLQRGAIKRKQTTVSLRITTIVDIQAIERGYPNFNFSAWCERVLMETYPRSFYAQGQVSWT